MSIKQVIIKILTNVRLKRFFWGCFGYGIALILGLVLQYSTELKLDPSVIAIIGVIIQGITKELNNRKLIPTI